METARRLPREAPRRFSATTTGDHPTAISSAARASPTV